MSTASNGRPSGGRRRALRPLALPTWWAVALGVVVVVVVAAVVVVVRLKVPPCRDQVVDRPGSPLLDPRKMQQQPDARLDQLAAAVTAMGSPFGDVLAGVGYDYGQWLHVYGVESGVLAFTKNNAPVTLLDRTTLKARWALRPDSKRIAWDASADRFLLLDLSAKAATRVSTYDVADGHRVWCATVDQEQSGADPVATAFLGNGDVMTALPSGDRIALTRLGHHDGTKVWGRDYSTLGRADYLGPLTDRLVVAGGVEEYRLADQAPESKGGPEITAVDTSNGSTAWTWSAPAGALAHVVGVEDGQVVVVERRTDGVRLLVLSDAGEERWSVAPEDAAYEATLRDGVVVMKSAAALYGYDVATGKQLWHTKVPTDHTYFPYGFTLDQMPSLDDTHVLMPTTTDLVALDVEHGTEVHYPLPVDGISTTYWPYQLLATPDLLGVVTNTGAVIARRE